MSYVDPLESRRQSMAAHAARGGWSEERVETMKRLWREGKSAAEIARTLIVTRNMVIAKLHRLGLSGRDGAAGRSVASHLNSKPRPAPRPPRLSTVTAMNRSPTFTRDVKTPGIVRDPTRFPDERPGPDACGLVELTSRSCRWPIGDPGSDEFRFCGQAKAPDPDLPYCRHHAQRAFVPPEKGRRATPDQLMKLARIA